MSQTAPLAYARSPQHRVIEFLDLYHAATTDQLAELFWGGRRRLAQYHLRRMVEAGRLIRHPHPTDRRGPYVYRLAGRVPGQKTVHQLAAVDFYLALRPLARQGARTVPELAWSDRVRPDQTVWWRQAVWAIEHHLNGPFEHAPDYARFLERGDYLTCHWWRRDVAPEEQVLGLLVVTEPQYLDRVRQQLTRWLPKPGAMRPGEPLFVWRVGTRANVLAQPASWLSEPRPTSPRSQR